MRTMTNETISPVLSWRSKPEFLAYFEPSTVSDAVMFHKGRGGNLLDHRRRRSSKFLYLLGT